VSKDELLDEVWPGAIVSVGALARAVVTVRQAIGDTDEAPLIRTLHRIGYRFVGEVSEVVEQLPDPVARPAVAAKPSDDSPITIALLPFENLTGDLSLDWTSLGLMALVGNALAIDARLTSLSVHALSSTLRRLPRDADVEQQAQALRRDDGVQHVIHARILRSERGYRLDYRLLGAPGGELTTLLADSPVALGRALARRLLAQLSRDPGEAGTADDLTARDPWALQVFARAMQSVAEQDLARAAHLLRVVLDLEPDYAEVRFELQRVETMQAGSCAAGVAGPLRELATNGVA